MTKSTSPQKIDKTMSITAANVVAFFLAIPIFILFPALHVKLWPAHSIAETFNASGLNAWEQFGLALLILTISVVVHEGLHGIGYRWGGAQWSDIKFGFQRLTPYAHCRVPLTVSAYRVAIALPGLVQGILPFLLGVGFGSLALTLLGTFMTVSALGDGLILWLLRNAPKEARILDHPSELGCILLLDSPGDNAP